MICLSNRRGWCYIPCHTLGMIDICLPVSKQKEQGSNGIYNVGGMAMYKLHQQCDHFSCCQNSALPSTCIRDPPPQTQHPLDAYILTQHTSPEPLVRLYTSQSLLLWSTQHLISEHFAHICWLIKLLTLHAGGKLSHDIDLHHCCICPVSNPVHAHVACLAFHCSHRVANR